jgi:hypothetical protein
MLKSEILEHWRTIKPNKPIAIEAVPYKHTGSTYDQDGIRITGTAEFIDSVLSRLTDLLDYEGDGTRLQLVYKESQDRETGAALGSFNCYIQVHERGREAQIMNGIIRGATERIAARKQKQLV